MDHISGPLLLQRNTKLGKWFPANISLCESLSQWWHAYRIDIWCCLCFTLSIILAVKYFDITFLQELRVLICISHANYVTSLTQALETYSDNVSIFKDKLMHWPHKKTYEEVHTIQMNIILQDKTKLCPRFMGDAEHVDICREAARLTCSCNVARPGLGILALLVSFNTSWPYDEWAPVERGGFELYYGLTLLGDKP